MAEQPIVALTWNLFHGRDAPPEPELFTARSKFRRVTERGERFVQVNRPLRGEFTRVLAALEWDVALLQEAPPRWLGPLCHDLGAGGASTLTSRNTLAPLRSFVAERNPDVIGSNEGGSNQLLARAPWRIDAVKRLTLVLRPERRRMIWARLVRPDGASFAVANLHGDTDRPRNSRAVLDAAAHAVAWARGLPLVFGGDLNLRPVETPDVFAELERRFGLAPATGPQAIDHLLASGVQIVEPPHFLPDTVRELRSGDGLALRLSDHACVAAKWRLQPRTGGVQATSG